MPVLQDVNEGGEPVFNVFAALGVTVESYGRLAVVNIRKCDGSALAVDAE